MTDSILDLNTYLRFSAALLFVLALIWLAAALARRFGWGMPSGAGTPRQRRLSVVETLVLDGRRRLVLVRRDGAEHLLLLGATGDLVVESGIRSGTIDGMARPNAAPDAALSNSAPGDAP